MTTLLHKRLTRRPRAAAVVLAAGLGLAAALGPVPATYAGDESEAPSGTEPDAGDLPTPEDFGALEPVEGAGSVDDATPIEAGKYVDTFPEDPADTRIYNFERTLPGSTIHWGITLLDDQRALGFITRLLVPRTSGQDVQTCGDISRLRSVYPTTMPLTTVGGISIGSDRCTSQDSMNIGVAALEQNAPAPGTPYQLVVWETPRVTNQGDIQTPGLYPSEPVEPVTPEDVTMQVEPGRTMSEAAVLPESGGYHVDLPPGQVGWFAMEVGDSEVLAVEAAVQDPERAHQGATIETRIIAPSGGSAGAPETAGGFSQFDPAYLPIATIGLRPARAQVQTESVGPYALSTVGSTSNDALITTAGWYYVAVYAQPLGDDEDATLPVTLTAGSSLYEVVLDEPQYAGGAEPEALPGPEGGPEPAEFDGAAAQQELEDSVAADEEAEEQADEAAAEDEGVPWWVWVVGVVVVLLVAGLGFVLARRGGTRDRRSPPQGPGPGGYGPGPGGPGGYGPGGYGGPGPGGQGQGPGQGPGQGGYGPGGPGYGQPPQGPGPYAPPPGGQRHPGPPTPPTRIRPGGPQPPAGPGPQAPPDQPQGPWRPGGAG